VEVVGERARGEMTEQLGGKNWVRLGVLVLAFTSVGMLCAISEARTIPHEATVQKCTIISNGMGWWGAAVDAARSQGCLCRTLVDTKRSQPIVWQRQDSAAAQQMPFISLPPSGDPQNKTQWANEA
jgi:hypothetical protein